MSSEAVARLAYRMGTGTRMSVAEAVVEPVELALGMLLVCICPMPTMNLSSESAPVVEVGTLRHCRKTYLW